MDCMFQLNVMRYIQTEDFHIKDAAYYYVVDAEKIYRNIWFRVGPIFVSSINESRSIESYTWSNDYSLQSFSFHQTTNIILDSYCIHFFGGLFVYTMLTSSK